tara:strand:+ start:1341 stop:2729 length:1389 start_codon:yes stop_codon:yes gene_type:complete
MKTSKSKRTNILKLFTLLAILFFYNCSNEDGIITEELNIQEDGLSTIPLESSLDFFKTINSNELSKHSKGKNSIDLEIDLETLEQIDVSDTNAKVNIANASTKFDNLETQVLQIEINGELQTVLLHHFVENDTAEKGASSKRCSSCYSVFSTNLSGIVLSAFKINSGKISKSYYSGNNLKSMTDDDRETLPGFSLTFKRNWNWAYTNYANTANHVHKYQFQRSMNNYSSMGTAYANYYRGKAIKGFDEKIDDKNLKPCLQNIINDLKKVSGSPGNMVAKFSGSFPGYNWEVKSGSLTGGTAQTDAPSYYNSATGSISTTFDSQSWSNATNLSWARTIIHASIHAYLASYYKISRPNWIATYPQMVQDWGAMQSWNDVHHEEIARSLVKSVAVALESYGINKGFNLSKQFYEDMSWAGLQETSTFKALPSSDQKRILDTIATELTGKDINGNNKTQKGKNAGC